MEYLSGESAHVLGSAVEISLLFSSCGTDTTFTFAAIRWSWTAGDAIVLGGFRLG
jgi:hypothetical protein